MLAQSAENKIQQASECLRGVAPTSMARRESDANLHLPRVIQPTVQTAIAHHDLGRLLDNSQLKPCPREYLGSRSSCSSISHAAYAGPNDSHDSTTVPPR